MRAVYCATVLFAANLGNLVIAPQMVGLLSDWFAPHHVAECRVPAARAAVSGTDGLLGSVALLPVGPPHPR